ncbi:MAG: hypothetical protein ACRYGF_18475 [Janthinobacterium lividum]
MILTIIGGSAHSTPVLIEALARLHPRIRLTVRLVGRDKARLHSVERACNLLAAGTVIEAVSYRDEQLNEALTGADIVLIQARISGYAGRAFDESFSLPYGIPGDEGLGPGGLSAAYRSWPQIRALLQRTKSIAPQALVILLSSPGSLLIRLAALTWPGWPVIGTCELPLTTLDHLCALTGADAAQVQFTYTGVNHLGFLCDVRTGAATVVTERELMATDNLLGRYIAQQQKEVFPSSALVAQLGGFPLKYLRLHFEPEQVAREQTDRTVSRADELVALSQRAFEVYRAGDAEAIRHVLSSRRVDWYEFAIIPLLLTKMGLPVSRPMFLTIALGNEELRERAYTSRDGAFVALPPSGLTPPALEALVTAFSEYEQAAARAVIDGSTEALTYALSLHPSFSDRDVRALAEAIVNQPFSRHDGACATPNENEELCLI